MAEEVGFGRAQADLERGKLEFAIRGDAWNLGNGADMVGGTGVNYDHQNTIINYDQAVEVRNHALQTADDLVDNDLNESPWHGLAAFWHYEPLEKGWIGVEKAVSATVSMILRRTLVEERHRKEQRKQSRVYFAKGVQHFVAHARNG